MDPLLLLFIAIAALLGLKWHRGGRQNVAMIVATTDVMERVFVPLDTTYVNIGGFVGYNFTYTLSPPFKRLEGTITTLPRHALLYLPLSRRLFHREDQLLFTLYCSELRTGQGHIIQAERYRHGAVALEDADELEQTTVERRSGPFLILWRNPLIRDRLLEMLGQLSETATECIRYIGYYGSDGHVAVTLHPGHPQIEETLREVLAVVSRAPAR